MLSYLTHIKYESKIQYAPEDVLTLAGTDYMDYYNERSERWKKARAIVAKKGGKSLNHLFCEVMAKMEKGEIAYNELRGIKKYRKLLFEDKYARQLERKSMRVENVAKQDYNVLCDKIQKKEITSLDEIIADADWNLAYKYHESGIIGALEKVISEILISKIQQDEITSLEEIETNRKWILANERCKKQIIEGLEAKASKILREKIEKQEVASLKELRAHKAWKSIYEDKTADAIKKELAAQMYKDLREKLERREITSLDEITANEDWALVYEVYRYQREGWTIEDLLEKR